MWRVADAASAGATPQSPAAAHECDATPSFPANTRLEKVGVKIQRFHLIPIRIAIRGIFDPQMIPILTRYSSHHDPHRSMYALFVPNEEVSRCRAHERFVL